MAKLVTTPIVSVVDVYNRQWYDVYVELGEEERVLAQSYVSHPSHHLIDVYLHDGTKLEQCSVISVDGFLARIRTASSTEN